MSSSPVFHVHSEDPALARAGASARDSFRYFWREMTWEMRRIVPGCDLAVVKAPFGEQLTKGWFSKETRDVVEQMWVSDVDFDGVHVRGTLLNKPNELRSIRAGDAVELPFDRISDWMYAIGGKAYGGWTIDVIRSQMPAADRPKHDAMWGLDFGPVNQVRLVPDDWGLASPDDEHPMSRSMAEGYKRPDMRAALLAPDARGWNQLHHLALAGAVEPLRALLSVGANPATTTPDGRTARDLAVAMGWKAAAELLGSPPAVA